MKNLITICLLFICAIGFSQERWTSYDTNFGLTSNVITDVYIENASSTWIATNVGINHINNTLVRSYTTSNSSLANNQVSKLVPFNNQIAMITGSGISVFDGISFSNFSSSNGLLSNSVKDIAADQSGNLWIAYGTGLSRFDGNQFFHDSARLAHSVAVDSNNNVYVLRYTAVFNIPSFNQPIYEIYDGTSWTSPAMNNFSFTVSNARLKCARNGQMLISGYGNKIIKLDYPFNLSEVNPSFRGQSLSSISAIEIAANGNTFLTAIAGPYSLFTSQDSIFEGYNTITAGITFTSVDVHAGKIIVGGNNGVFIANDNIKVSHTPSDISVNNIRTNIDVRGPFFNNYFEGRPAFEFPAGSNSHGIYAANIIVAAKANTDPSFTISNTAPYQYVMEPGPVSNGSPLDLAYIIKISKSEIQQHINNYSNPSYQMPDAIRNWPANGDSAMGIAYNQAPFFDVNNNGCYDPTNGDYPAILGDEAIYWINRPVNNPKKLEFHGMLYGYNSSTTPELNQALFLKYRIINRSNQNLDLVKAGFYMDADVGFAGDDYVGCDSLNNIAYAYNGDPFDDSTLGLNGYGANPPALGVKFLSDTMDTHAYFNIGTGINGDPTASDHWINYMDGKWKDGSPMKFGGNGYNTPGTSNIPTKYMFTGNPLNNIGWTEQNPGGSQPANSPGDRRSLSSIPYFSLNAGAEKTIDLVIGYGMKSSTTQFAENVPELIRVLNQVKNVYDTLTYAGFVYGTNQNCLVTSLSEQIAQPSSLSIYPNPSNGQFTIEAHSGLDLIQVYDLKGSLQFEKKLMNEQKQVIYLEEDLPNGIYFIRILNSKKELITKKLIIQR